jgi:hypothetical protein
MFIVIMTPSTRELVLGGRSARPPDTGIRISTELYIDERLSSLYTTRRLARLVPSLIIIHTLTQLGKEKQFTTELYEQREKTGRLGDNAKRGYLADIAAGYVT